MHAHAAGPWAGEKTVHLLREEDGFRSGELSVGRWDATMGCLWRQQGRAGGQERAAGIQVPLRHQTSSFEGGARGGGWIDRVGCAKGAGREQANGVGGAAWPRGAGMRGRGRGAPSAPVGIAYLFVRGGLTETGATNRAMK